jgi:hypothetical protein
VKQCEYQPLTSESTKQRKTKDAKGVGRNKRGRDASANKEARG